MDAKIRYSDLLTDILKKGHSKCICPTAFLGNLKKLEKGPEDLCLFDHSDEFGTSCQFSPRYTPELTLSKSNSQRIICDPEVLKPTLPKKNSAYADAVVKPNCSCVGTCFCKSEESTLKKGIKPLTGQLDCNRATGQLDCNRAKCICSTCFCQNATNLKDLFPQPFRNNIKRGGLKLMTDEMKKECEEIKQIINDYKQVEIDKPIKSSVKNKKSKASQSKDSIPTLTGSFNGRNKSSVFSSNRSSPLLKKSVQALEFDHEVNSQTNNEKHESFQKKDKVNQLICKQINFKHYLKKNITGRRKLTLKKRSLQVRYYYSGGGTENYGVKLGHKKCLPRLELVPKHMGWLWTYEDTTKGKRERRGWPPGLIGGKSITNMIQEIKHHESNMHHKGKLLERKRLMSHPTVVTKDVGLKEDPPLLHIHKKGRTYNITFCPKNSDDEVGPIPIPLTIKGDKQDGDSDTSDSTLEFEFHSPKPRLKSDVPVAVPATEKTPSTPSLLQSDPEPSIVPPPSSSQQNKQRKKKLNKKRSLASEENRVPWEEQPTQIQNIL